MLLNLQRFANARFCRFSLRALRADSFFCPARAAARSRSSARWLIDLIARLSEPRWHTTRVSPRAFACSAEASERAFGTLPPAAGLTLLSGAGSGQYELRST